MIKLTAASHEWKNTGQYIARITGRSPKYGFERQFTGKKEGQSTTAYVDEPGLYETCDIDKKGRKEVTCGVIIPRPSSCPPLKETNDADLMLFWLHDSDAAAIAGRLDKGEDVAAMIEVSKLDDGTKYEYRLRKPGEAKKASTAATIDQAVEQCWQILQSFPEREAKKVLAALKARVAPKPAVEQLAAQVAEVEQPVMAGTEPVE